MCSSVMHQQHYCVPSLNISVQLVQTDVFYDLAQNNFLLLMKQSLMSEVVFQNKNTNKLVLMAKR